MRTDKIAVLGGGACSRDVAQLVYSPVLCELSLVIHTHNPSTQEGKAGESENQGHPQIQKEFKMSLSCMSPCLKVKKKKMVGKTSS